MNNLSLFDSFDTVSPNNETNFSIINLVIHHSKHGETRSYRQTFDGGDFEIEYTEKMDIWADNVESIDFTSMIILDNFIENHNHTFVDEIMWGQHMDTFDHYLNEQQAKALLDELNNNDKIRFTISPYISRIELVDKGYLRINNLYNVLFLGKFNETIAIFDDIKQHEEQKLSILKHELLIHQLKIESAEKKIAGIEKEKEDACYSIFKQLIMNGSLAKNVIIKYYNISPIELAVNFKDRELFNYLIEDDIKDVFCLKDVNHMETNTSRYRLTPYTANVLCKAVWFYFEYNRIQTKTLVLNMIKLLDKRMMKNTIVEIELRIIWLLLILSEESFASFCKELKLIFVTEDSNTKSKIYEILLGLLSQYRIESVSQDAIFLDISEHPQIFDCISSETKRMALRVLHLLNNAYSTEALVDLGLPSGTLWANFNIEDILAIPFPLFRWGKEELCTKTIGTDMDIIKSVLGGNWSIPKPEHFQELIDNCCWVWQENVLERGHRFSGYRIYGKNDHSIFIKAVGYIDKDGRILQKHEGFYWTCIPTANKWESFAKALHFNKSIKQIESFPILCSLCIKPIFCNTRA